MNKPAMSIPEQARPLQVEISEQIARDASCSQGEFNQRVLSIIPYLTDVCDRASLVGVEQAVEAATKALAPHISGFELDMLSPHQQKDISETARLVLSAALPFMGVERAAIIEECAKVAETYNMGGAFKDDMLPKGWRGCRRRIAAEIRALSAAPASPRAEGK